MLATLDRREALRVVPVSRETEGRLAIYVDLLDRWRGITNLISGSSFDHVWTRHIADCAQLPALAPKARRWLDLGSGAGFPGLVIAIQLADVPDAIVHLVESDQRKCAFLREVARHTGAPAVVHSIRVESIPARHLSPVDAVTARAFAPLPQLMDLAKAFLLDGAVGIFPRGRSVEAQIAELPVGLPIQLERHISKLDQASSILLVRSRESKSPKSNRQPKRQPPGGPRGT